MARTQRRRAARRSRAQLVRAQLTRRLPQLRLVQRRLAVSMKSWRKKKPKWLNLFVHQFKMICWAIGFIRHYEFLLKQNGVLRDEDHLSIQDFINNTPKSFFVRDGSDYAGTFVKPLSYAAAVLKYKGVLLERDCQLTESLVDAPLSDPGLKRHFPTDVRVHTLNPSGCIVNGHFVPGELDPSHDRLCKLLKSNCVAARIEIYDSYNELEGQEIYYPTKHELDCCRPNGHVVLLTRYAFDEQNRLFYQYQESYGRHICDGGYAYIYADLVTDYVDIEL